MVAYKCPPPPPASHPPSPDRQFKFLSLLIIILSRLPVILKLLKWFVDNQIQATPDKFQAISVGWLVGCVEA